MVNMGVVGAVLVAGAAVGTILVAKILIPGKDVKLEIQQLQLFPNGQIPVSATITNQTERTLELQVRMQVIRDAPPFGPISLGSIQLLPSIGFLGPGQTKEANATLFVDILPQAKFTAIVSVINLEDGSIIEEITRSLN